MNLRHLSIFLSWTIICILPALQAQDLNDGLVAYYPFNGNANDESGNGRNGVEHGGISPSNDRAGNPNAAYGLDGANDHIRGPVFPDSDSFSASVWLEVNVESADRQFIFHDGNSTSGRDCFAEIRNGELWFGTKDNDDLKVPQTSVALDRWHHLTCIADAPNNTKSIWLNGTKVAENINWTGTANVGFHDAFTLGAYHGGGTDHYFSGRLDDIRIYNRALSEEDVAALYELETWDHTDGLVAYYPFNGNADDESGNSLHGVPTDTILTPDRNGVPDSAYQFQPHVDSQIRIADDPLLNFDDQFTVSYWAKFDETWTFHQESLIYKFDLGSLRGWHFGADQNDAQNGAQKYRYALQVGEAGNAIPSAFEIVDFATISGWHHVTGVLRDSTIEFYLDGVLVASSSGPANVHNVANDLIIGGALCILYQEPISVTWTTSAFTIVRFRKKKSPHSTNWRKPQPDLSPEEATADALNDSLELCGQCPRGCRAGPSKASPTG